MSTEELSNVGQLWKLFVELRSTADGHTDFIADNWRKFRDGIKNLIKEKELLERTILAYPTGELTARIEKLEARMTEFATTIDTATAIIGPGPRNDEQSRTGHLTNDPVPLAKTPTHQQAARRDVSVFLTRIEQFTQHIVALNQTTGPARDAYRFAANKLMGEIEFEVRRLYGMD